MGVFGPGWKAPLDIRLQIRDEGLNINDSGGRSIHFEPLFPGEISYSRSESFWLARGGVLKRRQRPSACTALAGVAGSGPSESTHLYDGCQHKRAVADTRLAGACAGRRVPPPEPPAYRVLTGVVDGFGRSLIFHREAAGELAGEITGVTDGAGRRFHLALSTQAQRAEAFRKQRVTSLSSPAGPRSVSSFFRFSPTRCPPVQSTVPITVSRLKAVWLTHDPAYPDEQPTAPLARYTYTASGTAGGV